MVVSVGTLRPKFRVSLASDTTGFVLQQTFGNSLSLGQTVKGCRQTQDGKGATDPPTGFPTISRNERRFAICKSNCPVGSPPGPDRQNANDGFPGFLSRSVDGTVLALLKMIFDILHGGVPPDDCVALFWRGGKKTTHTMAVNFLRPGGPETFFLLPLMVSGPLFSFGGVQLTIEYEKTRTPPMAPSTVLAWLAVVPCLFLAIDR